MYLSLLFLLVCVQLSVGWWCSPHMAVMQIAKSVMSSSTIDKLEKMIQEMSAQGPFPQSSDLVEAACWPDDLKSLDLVSMASWHFTNLPYNPENVPIAKWPVQEENVASVIMELSHTAKKASNDWILKFSLANLIHFYGDVHQPLHTAELFSSEYPTGDEGGNRQKVSVKGNHTSLHFVWDAVCWTYTDELARPLSSSDRKIIVDFANRLMSTYKFTDAQKKEYNSTVMAQESFDAAVKYAYPGVRDGTVITQEYLDRCIPVAEARVALAGYRLGNELEYIFRSRPDAHPQEMLRTIHHRSVTLVRDARKA